MDRIASRVAAISQHMSADVSVERSPSGGVGITTVADALAAAVSDAPRAAAETCAPRGLSMCGTSADGVLSMGTTSGVVTSSPTAATTGSVPRAGAVDSSSRTTPTGHRIDPSGVYVVGVARTALGSFQGAFASLSAPQLGSVAIRAALSRSGVSGEEVGEVFFGNVCSANVGQSPARQASLGAGLPLGVDVTTINKVCSSGLKAIALGASSILSSQHDVVLAGGMESMTNVPYYVPAARSGARLGDSTLVDGMIKDGLWDPYEDIHMGECAERVADEFQVSREAMDSHALESVRRAVRAREAGITRWEIAPVAVKGTRGKPDALVVEDEAVSKMDAARLPKLRPSFRRGPDGRVTPGNASPITDGAAALVLVSGRVVLERNLAPLALVRGFADGAVQPDRFPVAPSVAAPKALARAGLSTADVDVWEINEAFSIVHLVNRRVLGIADDASVNPLGGAVALGHPIGASGARIVVTLINGLRALKKKIGCAAICNGGGGSSAIVLEYVGDYA